MTEYGHVINPNYDPSKNKVYETFCDYFNNPTITKIKNVEYFSVYMAKIFSMIGNSYRYLVLFVDRDYNNEGFKQSMKNCEWISLQTRTLTEKMNVEVHGYAAMSEGQLTATIIRTGITKEASTYKCNELPLTITLLHTEKKDSNVYQPKGTVIAAIETYETIITF